MAGVQSSGFNPVGAIVARFVVPLVLYASKHCVFEDSPDTVATCTANADVIAKAEMTANLTGRFMLIIDLSTRRRTTGSAETRS
jgi:hypothetical protein